MSKTFGDLVPKLSSDSLDAISSFGFKTMTPVQATSIPLFMSNKVNIKKMIGLDRNYSYFFRTFA